MDSYSTSVAARLDQHRAAALTREVEMRRSIADRGAAITPARPVVDAVRDLGIWLRGLVTPRIRFSH